MLNGQNNGGIAKIEKLYCTVKNQNSLFRNTAQWCKALTSV